AELAAEHEAREIVARLLGEELAGKPSGPDREEPRQEARGGGLVARGGKAFPESRPIRLLARLRHPGNEGWTQEGGVDPSGDGPAERADAPRTEGTRLARGSGEDAGPIGFEAEPDELRLLAAHHIREGPGAAVGEPWQEEDTAAIGEADAPRRRCDLGKPGR